MEKIKNSLSVSRAVYTKVKETFVRGMSENDIKKVILDTCGRCSFGGDIVAGVRSSLIEGDATDYVPKDGDTLILDLQFNADGVWCDTTRTFFVGAPSDEVRCAYEAVLAAKSAGEAALSNGVRACDIHAAVCRGFGSYAEYFPHHAGHLVGLQPVEKPQFLADCTCPVYAGSIAALEPGVYFEGKFGIRVEDNYFIKEKGFENLFDYTVRIEDFIL